VLLCWVSHSVRLGVFIYFLDFDCTVDEANLARGRDHNLLLFLPPSAVHIIDGFLHVLPPGLTLLLLAVVFELLEVLRAYAGLAQALLIKVDASPTRVLDLVVLDCLDFKFGLVATPAGARSHFFEVGVELVEFGFEVRLACCSIESSTRQIAVETVGCSAVIRKSSLSSLFLGSVSLGY